MPDPLTADWLAKMKVTMAVELSRGMTQGLPPKALIELLFGIPEVADRSPWWGLRPSEFSGCLIGTATRGAQPRETPQMVFGEPSPRTRGVNPPVQSHLLLLQSR